MELFIPSVLVLLLAAAVIFFVIPRFGAPVLALISVGLLAFGIYQHMNAFGNEYRLSTWQHNLANYSPYIMVGGLLVVIAFYLITISPLGKPTAPNVNMPEMPKLNEMPSANTATNVVTAGVNNALKGLKNVAGNAAAAVGVSAANKQNNKGVAAPAVEAVNNAAKKAAEGLKNALAGITSAANEVKNVVTGNVPKNNKGPSAPTAPPANVKPPNVRPPNNKGKLIPGLGVPFSQI